MNIKSSRAHELARKAAALAGITQTSAVEHALEYYLRELENQRAATAVRVDQILDALDARLTDQDRAAFRSADLYDNTGLPR
ncbi:MAG: type II toxin-antitoxin system VapB family antitoxin [Actinomycetota bacterium]